MFNRNELLMLKELVEEEVAKRKDNGDYDLWSGDKEVFESILKKTTEELETL